MGHLGFAPRADWRYLPRHAQGGGRGDDQPTPGERDAGNYYMASVEGGEPPGVWAGPGVAVLGVEGGSEVTSEQMETVFGQLVHPETGEQLGSRPRSYASHEERVARLLAAEPDAGPERRAEIEFAARKAQREACHYYDLTFTPEKSWSVLYAGLRQAGMDAEAGALWSCVEEGYRVGLDHLMGQACYARTGRHSGKVAGRSSGRWERAGDWVVTLWRHHTSRAGDPSLHIHGAVLNRVRVNGAGKWYALDGVAVKNARREAAAVMSRVAEARAAERLGLRFVSRPDGLGREIAGVDPALIEAFSSRRRAIEPEAQALARAYTERYGREPSPYELRLFAQQATMRTRQRKPEHPPTLDEQLAGWEAQVRQRLGGSLAQVPAQAQVPVRWITGAAEAQPAQGEVHDAQRHGAPLTARQSLRIAEAQGQAQAARLTEAQRAQVVAQALATVSGARSVWRRADIAAAIDAHLPADTLRLPAEEQARLVDELTGRALRDATSVRLAAEPLVTPPAGWRRSSDGRGLHEPAAVYDRYTAVETLEREQRLVDTATEVGAPAGDTSAADVQGLRDDQRAAVEHVIGSGRGVDVLIGPAGSGKSHTLGALAHAWTHAVPPGEAGNAPRVLGLGPSEVATRVLADRGIQRTMNIAQFLQPRKTDPVMQDLATVRPADLVIVDEASMASTCDLEQIITIAEHAGGKVLLAGDDRQLGAVEQGGAFALLAERAEPVQLTGVARFEHPWEAEASLRLRAGDATGLREYDRRGRIFAGSTEEMRQEAAAGFVADYITGRDSLVITGTNEHASELASHIRAQLIEHGRVEADGVALADETRAGVGDLIQTRQNDRQLVDGAGAWVANRDVFEVVDRDDDGSLTIRRQLSRDQDGETECGDPVRLPAWYVGEDVRLAYAGTVHAAQGRDVDTTYTLVDPGMGPEAFYVAATRARHRTLLLVPLDAEQPDRLGPQATEPEQQPTAEAILAGIIERDREPESALQTLDTEVDARESLARLAPEWQDLITSDAHARYRDRLQQLLSEAQWDRLETDPAAAPLLRAVRAAEVSGRDADRLLTQAITARELDSATSIGQVLHHRVTADTPPDQLAAESSYAAGTPQLADPELSGYAHRLADTMDARVVALGEQASTDPPAWANPLGPVPDDPADRLEWTRRAGVIAAYREEHGYRSERDAIGPAPHADAPEAQQGWLAAWDALGRPDEQRDTAAASDGHLLNVLEAWQREQDAAPANVDEELRAAYREADSADRQARTHDALAQTAQLRGRPSAEHTSRRDQARQVEQAARQRAAQLEEAAQVRQAWYETAQPQRRAAELARRELQNRHDRDLARLTNENQQQREPQREREPAHATIAMPEERQAGPAEDSERDTQVAAARRAVDQTQRNLARRQGQADPDTEPSTAPQPDRDRDLER